MNAWLGGIWDLYLTFLLSCDNNKSYKLDFNKDAKKADR